VESALERRRVMLSSVIVMLPFLEGMQ